MAKIFSKSGDSLADIYDVAGSIAGIEQLQSEDVNLVHEMGTTIFSERFAAAVFTLASGSILQSTDFEVQTTIGATVTRLLGVRLVSNATGRISRAQLSLTSTLAPTDMPIYAWDSTDGETTIDVHISGGTTTQFLLHPLNQIFVPNLLIGSDSELPVRTISMRGASSAFGAGNVTVTAILYMGFSQLGGVSSRGLPVPSW